jgi:hypothetical protein
MIQRIPGGSWKRDSPYAILVEPQSAIHQGTSQSLQYPVNKDHSNLVKFAEGDYDLLAVLKFMQSAYDRLNYHNADIMLHHHEGASKLQCETGSELLAVQDLDRLRSPPESSSAIAKKQEIGK